MALPDGIHAGVRLVEVPEERDAAHLPGQNAAGRGVHLPPAADGVPADAHGGALSRARRRAGDLGNVGTILRTLDAFEADGLVLLPGCADPFSPKTVRSSMGAVFRRPVWTCTAETFAQVLRGSGLRLLGAALRMTRSTRARRTIPARCSRSARRGAAYLTRCSRSATRRCASPCRRAASRSMRRSRHRFSCGRHIAENHPCH